MDPEVTFSESPTGAVRSNDLAKERWDLISGTAMRQLSQATSADLEKCSVPQLINYAIDSVYEFLGYDIRYPDPAIKWDLDKSTRQERLVRAWACLCAAIKIVDTCHLDPKEVTRDYVPPYYGLRACARACAEGVVKYGEENWHNGFRTKEVLNHALAHMIKWLNGFREEDDLGHASWNLMVALHNMECRPDLNDLLLGPEYQITDEIKAYHDKLKKLREDGGSSTTQQQIDTAFRDKYLKESNVKI